MESIQLLGNVSVGMSKLRRKRVLKSVNLDIVDLMDERRPPLTCLIAALRRWRGWSLSNYSPPLSLAALQPRCNTSFQKQSP